MSVKKGIIVIWFGAIADIPYGWKLCDGSGSTPDLRGRIVLGTGPAAPVGNTGGSINHDHDFTSDPHSHTIETGDGISETFAVDQETDTAVDTGTTGQETGMPPYHALAYIQRIF